MRSISAHVAYANLHGAQQKLVLACINPLEKMDKRHYPKLNNRTRYASSGFGFLKKLAMDGWFAGAAGPFFETSLGL